MYMFPSVVTFSVIHCVQFPSATVEGESLVFLWTAVSGATYKCIFDGGAEFDCKCTIVGNEL